MPQSPQRVTGLQCSEMGTEPQCPRSRRYPDNAGLCPERLTKTAMFRKGHRAAMPRKALRTAPAIYREPKATTGRAWPSDAAPAFTGGTSMFSSAGI